MNESPSYYLSLEELCLATELPSETVIEIVEEGIIEPSGDTPNKWTFSTNMVVVVKRACRLHQDLEIDWSGIALALSLIEELDQLRAENRQLQTRLGRFCSS